MFTFWWPLSPCSHLCHHRLCEALHLLLRRPNLPSLQLATWVTRPNKKMQYRNRATPCVCASTLDSHPERFAGTISPNEDETIVHPGTFFSTLGYWREGDEFCFAQLRRRTVACIVLELKFPRILKIERGGLGRGVDMDESFD